MNNGLKYSDIFLKNLTLWKIYLIRGVYHGNKDMVLTFTAHPVVKKLSVHIYFKQNKKGMILRLPVHPASSGQEVMPLSDNSILYFGH